MVKKIRIAIIDSGIDTNNSYFGKYIYDGKWICHDGKECSIKKNFHDDNGHGTLCASVILKECQDVQFYVIKIMNRYGVTNLATLEYALEYLKNKKINIISLSLSIVEGNYSKKIKSLCNYYYEKGVIIVCSFSNQKRKSYPAAFKSVIGVRGFILENEKSIWERKRGREIIVDYNPYLYMGLEGQYVLYGKSNSYACAKMTGIIAKKMKELNCYSVQEIKKWIVEKAERHNWISFVHLRKSKRFPQFCGVSMFVDENILEILMTELKVDKKEIFYKYSLFDERIGLKYEECGQLLNKIANFYQIENIEYESISRYDFYSIYTISHLVEGIILGNEKYKFETLFKRDY